jgi:hypothetical protein
MYRLTVSEFDKLFESRWLPSDLNPDLVLSISEKCVKEIKDKDKIGDWILWVIRS